MNNRNRITISHPRTRTPQFRTAISCPRLGAYCIRPTNDPERGEYVQNRTNVSCTRARITQNRTNPAYIRKWMTQIHGIRFLPKTFVGRMQYAPTRGRKWHMPIRIHHFKPYNPLLPFCNVLVWDREGRVRSCGGIAWAENIKWWECYLVALIEQLSRKNVS